MAIVEPNKKPITTPAYGSNVAGFDPNNAQHVALANAGQDWWKAKAAGDTGGMNAASATGTGIRGGLSGSTFDAQKGISTLGSPQPAVYSGPSASDLINQQYTAQAENAKQQAYSNKNLADVQSMQNMQALKEMMASKGLGASGDNITATVGQQASRLGALNNIDMQLAQQLRDLDAQKAKDLMNEQRYQSETAYSHGRDTVADNRYNSETSYNHGRDSLSDTRYNDETNYAHGRDTVADTRYTDETNYSHGRDNISDTRYTDETNYNRGQDTLRNNLARVTENRIAKGGSSGGSGGSTSKPPSTNTVITNVNKLFRSYNPSTKSYSINNPDALINYVVNSFPDDPQYDDDIQIILDSYGVQLPNQNGTPKQDLFDRPVSGPLSSY